MIRFGRRKIHIQGGSCLISLPIIWVRNIIFLEVEIEQNPENSLRILPAHAAKHVEGDAESPEVEVVA